MTIRALTDVDLHNKRVLIREDFNVPMQHGKIMDDSRIRAALPTIEYALTQGAAVILLSHLGRPIEGKYDPEFSLASVAERLSIFLNKPVRFEKEKLDKLKAPESGEIILLENVRFYRGETSSDDTLARQMANLCDVFVMDAFAAAHRAHASTYGVTQYAPVACAGLLLMKEVSTLRQILHAPVRPLVAVVGGAKVSTKLKILESLLTRVDALIPGGGIANTFLAALGLPVGQSLYEPELLDTAKNLLDIATQKGLAIVLPADVVVAKDIREDAQATVKSVREVEATDKILDIGPKTARVIANLINQAGTVLWNGPLGVFETTPFATGTETIANAIANSHAFSVAGGGDTLAAIEKFGIAHRISYISTGGGAFLEFLEGETLPALTILEIRSS